MYVEKETLVEQVQDDFQGVLFEPENNLDLCPSQKVASLIQGKQGLTQLNPTWGIKPSWSKRLLINAKAETVADKKTFSWAFQHQRCIVPCSGWFEWNKDREKFLFQQSDGRALYMAGIYYGYENPQLVTMTVEPNNRCRTYHHRMPLLIKSEHINTWFSGNSQQCQQLMKAVDEQWVSVTPF
ncbi:MAG: SOS response-associated peptidase family protein [bacterium]